jgi:hypothetical protein
MQSLYWAFPNNCENPWCQKVANYFLGTNEREKILIKILFSKRRLKIIENIMALKNNILFNPTLNSRDYTGLKCYTNGHGGADNGSVAECLTGQVGCLSALKCGPYKGKAFCIIEGIDRLGFYRNNRNK